MKKHLFSFKGPGLSELGNLFEFYDFRVWARSVCINDSLEKGSMLPLIQAAQKNGYSVIVFNPNLNYDKKTGVNIS